MNLEHNPYLDMSDDDFIKLLESNGFKVVDGTGKIIALDDNYIKVIKCKDCRFCDNHIADRFKPYEMLRGDNCCYCHIKTSWKNLNDYCSDAEKNN